MDQLARERLADDPASKDEHVHVVVLDSLMGRVGIVTESRANAAVLVGGDRGADAAAADQHGALARPGQDRGSDRRRVVGVVDRFLGVRSEILDVMAVRDQELDDEPLDREARVIGRDCNPHDQPSAP